MVVVDVVLDEVVVGFVVVVVGFVVVVVGFVVEVVEDVVVVGRVVVVVVNVVGGPVDTKICTTSVFNAVAPPRGAVLVTRPTPMTGSVSVTTFVWKPLSAMINSAACRCLADNVRERRPGRRRH